MANPAPSLSAPSYPRRLRDLDAGQWRLLGEALLFLAGTSAAIAFLPFRRVVKLASRDTTAGPVAAAPARFDVAAIGWAVETVAWRLPWRTVCFQKGLSLHLMARRRGIASVLHYGVGKEDGKLAAHVWISVDGRIVQGGEQANRFHLLASYPAAPPGSVDRPS